MIYKEKEKKYIESKKCLRVGPWVKNIFSLYENASNIQLIKKKSF